MANLTEDQQRAFGDRIVEICGDSDTAASCTAAESGLDPSKRLAKLDPLQGKASKAEVEQTKAKAALKTATEKSQAATGAFYTEASSAAEAIISAIGEGHALSQEIRKLRGGMTNAAARGPNTPAAPSTPAVPKP
jgi:hypothetical protein